MRYFDAALLVRTTRIAVEHAGTEFAGSRIAFNGSRISEFAAPVSQDDRKELSKQFHAELILKIIEDICDGTSSVSIPEEG
jgi:hypothetical protein